MSAKNVSMLATIIGFNLNASNVANMLFTVKGDNYMAYIKANKMNETASYPSLRAALEKDLTTLAMEFDRTGETRPWGKMSVKMKSHSLAVSMYKTWQRRIIFEDVAKDTVSLTAEMFTRFDKKENKELHEVKEVTRKTVFKSYDKAAALTFLNSYLNK